MTKKSKDIVYNRIKNSNQIKIYGIFWLNAPVAQLDRALGYGPGGSGFNS